MHGIRTRRGKYEPKGRKEVSKLAKGIWAKTREYRLTNCSLEGNLSTGRGKNHLNPLHFTPEPWQNDSNSCQIFTLSKEASCLRKIRRTSPFRSINKEIKQEKRSKLQSCNCFALKGKNLVKSISKIEVSDL